MADVIRQDLDRDATAVIDIVKSGSADDHVVDGVIDTVTDAISDVELDDTHNDGDDIDAVEGLEPQEIDIYADDENDAAEIELMNDAGTEDADDTDDEGVTEEIVDAVQEAMSELEDF